MPVCWYQTRTRSGRTVGTCERRACVPHAWVDGFPVFGAPGSYASRSSGVTMSSPEPRRRCSLLFRLGPALAPASPYPQVSSQSPTLTQDRDLAVGAAPELPRAHAPCGEMPHGAAMLSSVTGGGIDATDTGS